MSKNNTDVWSIFKTLDEYEMPETLNESVRGIAKVDGRQGMDSLMEEFYDFNEPAEIDELKKAREDEVAQAKLAKIEKIVDLDADTVDDLQPSYIGKTIIQCPKCMTLFYKDRADLVVDENDPTIVNVSEVCQHCGNDTGYTVIGQVAEEAPVEEKPEEVAPVDELPAEETPTEATEEPNPDEAPAEEEKPEDSAELEKIPDLEEIEPDTGDDEANAKEPKNESLREDIGWNDIWDHWDNLINILDADQIVKEVAKYFSTDDLKGFINSVEKDYDIEFSLDESWKSLDESLILNEDKVETLGDTLDKDPLSPKNMKLFFDQEWEDIQEDLDLNSIEEIDEESLNKCITEGFKKAGINYKDFKATYCTEKDGKILIEGKATMSSGDKIDYSLHLDNKRASGKNPGSTRLFSKDYALECKKVGNKLITENFHFKNPSKNR